jgi:cob(I)alamin adenosyltransferase
MGNRLSQIATRTGDDGTTGLGDGSRTSKDSLRIAALGEVDELNSQIGVLLAEALPDEVREALLDIQHDLFDLGGELCIPGYENVDDSQVARLDELLAHFNATLPRLQEFILPGGSRPAAVAHVARTVARRAERAIVALGAQEPVRPACRQYVNRLSDLMFVLARVLNRSAGGTDVLWQQGRNKAPKAEQGS